MLSIASVLGSSRSLPLRSVGRARRSLRSFALAIVLALAVISVPGGAIANPSGEATAESQPTPRSAAVGTGTEVAPAANEDYAARERSAKNLEKFQGGDTTVILSGSVLVIILVVVLVLVII